MAEGVGIQPGPERGLAWGENGRGRIVIPMDVVAKLAASVVQPHTRADTGATRDEFLDGFATGLQNREP